MVPLTGVNTGLYIPYKFFCISGAAHESPGLNIALKEEQGATDYLALLRRGGVSLPSCIF